MKILVSGCSFSVGYGFAESVGDPRLWTNLLGQKLNATVTNVAIPGYDNAGIFLNAISEFTDNKYDLILIQITALNRITLSPSIHEKKGLMQFLNENFDKKTDKDYFEKLIAVNQDFEHWARLRNIIFSVQNLVDKGYNIKFVNGLLNWDPTFFEKNRSRFGDSILNVEGLPDKDIALGIEMLNRDKQKINLDLWINPFNSFLKIQVDNASPTDSHPGVKSQQIYSELVFNHLQSSNKRK
jgi:hypothetical protein